MDKIRYRLVFNRKHKLNSQGYALIQAEASLNNRRIYFSTRVYISPGAWDCERSQVVNHDNATDLNAFLYEFLIKMQTIELNFWKRGAQCTLALLKDEMKKNKPVDFSFNAFASNAIESSDRRQSTKDSLMLTLKSLNDFRKGFDFGDITFAFVKDYEVWLQNKGKAPNTVAKHLRQLRTLVNEAINQNYMKVEDYPFRKFRIKKDKGKHIALMPAELKKLEGMRLEKYAHRKILDGFLFCCYSGLRYSDFRRLTDEHLIKIRGKQWLQIKMQKTNMEIRSPLYLLFDGKALGIISRYGNLKNLASIGDNSHVNSGLKHIMRKAGIEKRVTWHTSRHTCASLLVYDGVNITTVQKLLGHTSIRTTEIYADVFSDTVVKDLKSVKKKRKVRNKVDYPGSYQNISGI